MFPEILLPSVRSMYIEDGYGVSLVLYRDCLEAAVREGLVLPFQTHRVNPGSREVSTHIGEEVVTNQTLSDGFLVAFDAKRRFRRAIRHTSFLEHEDLREEELVTTCHGVEVHGDGLKLGDGNDVP